MKVSTCADREKTVPVGNGLDIDGVAVRRCRNMIYWYRWGRHTFDIRVMRELLGLSKDHAADKYFMPGNEYAGDADRALIDNVSNIASNLDGQPFKSLMKQHDVAIRSNR
jgi:hypothetical protein